MSDVTDYVYQIANEFEALNSKYIEIMGKHIRDIGKLSATDIHRTEQMIRMGANVESFKKELAQLSGKATAEVDALYDSLLVGNYKDSEELYNLRNGMQIPLEENIQLLNFVESLKRATKDTFKNISNTTVIDSTYRDLVDSAIYQITQGTIDYKSALRSILKDASAGARVQYASGLTRRMDSAVRMNVLEGVRILNQGYRQISGEQFGADGYEISAHGYCAIDHVGIQGRQYSKKDFEDLNAGLNRPIGTLNCKHTIFPIVMGISQPAYSDSQLEKMKRQSTEQIVVDGVSHTGYEWTQVCRKLETEMRYAKDTSIMGKAAGDDVLVRRAEDKLNALRSKYRRICDEVGLPKKYDRAYVPGYRGTQVKPEKIKIVPVQITPATPTITPAQNLSIEEMKADALKRFAAATSDDDKLSILQEFGSNLRTDVSKILDDKAAAIEKMKEEKLQPLFAKYNNAYADLYEKYSVLYPDRSLDDFDRDWDDVKQLVEWQKSYTEDYRKYLKSGDAMRAEQARSRIDYYNKSIIDKISSGRYADNFAYWADLVNTYGNVYETNLEIRKASRLTIPDGIEITKSVLSKYRNLGVPDVKRISDHLYNSKSHMRKIVEQAYQLYPTEWVENSINTGGLVVKKVSRGYYSHYAREIALSGDSDLQCLETAIHELGHRFERTQKISPLETMLYNKRTAGEELTWMGSGYRKDEKTRVDNWLNKYMGKDYGGDAYEIISMGFQYAYTDPKLLLKDQEFADFIFGILALL